MNPHFFEKLDPDTDPHSPKKLDPDPKSIWILNTGLRS
jgi:hypothetical protein